MGYSHCIIYIDDVVVFSNNFKEHMRNLELVLEKMREYNVVAKLKKCALVREELKYLGYIIGNGQLKANLESVQKILNMPTPKTLKEVPSFVCMASYFRRFIKNFSKKVKPLTDFQRKEEFMKLKKKKKRE